MNYLQIVLLIYSPTFLWKIKFEIQVSKEENRKEHCRNSTGTRTVLVAQRS